MWGEMDHLHPAELLSPSKGSPWCHHTTLLQSWLSGEGFGMAAPRSQHGGGTSTNERQRRDCPNDYKLQ